MLFNIDFTNNTILSCFFFFLIIELYFLILAGLTKVFSFTAELVVPIEIPTKETKAEMEKNSVTVEIKIIQIVIKNSKNIFMLHSHQFILIYVILYYIILYS